MGMYSYSVYLWHRSVLTWGLLLLRRGFHIEVHPLTNAPVPLVVSLIVSILMSRLIECPMLRVRDRLFPVMLSPSLERVSKSRSS